MTQGRYFSHSKIRMRRCGSDGGLLRLPVHHPGAKRALYGECQHSSVTAEALPVPRLSGIHGSEWLQEPAQHEDVRAVAGRYPAGIRTELPEAANKAGYPDQSGSDGGKQHRLAAKM